MTAHVVGGDEIHFPHLHPQTDQIFLIPTLRQAQWKEKRDGLKHGIAEEALRPTCAWGEELTPCQPQHGLQDARLQGCTCSLLAPLNAAHRYCNHADCCKERKRYVCHLGQ